MATKKISELEAITKAEDDDLLVIVDNSEEETKKIEKKDFLNELNEMIKELQEDLSDAEENQLTAPASGESIDLNDSAKEKIRNPKLIGKSWQNTRSGKNLFDGNNPTSENSAQVSFEDDIVTESSTITTMPPYSMWVLPVSEGDIIRLSGIILDTNGQIAIQKNNGSTNLSINSIFYNNGSTPGNLNYTVESGIVAVRVLLYANKTTPSGDSSSRYKQVIVTKNNSDMTYEEYGVMPSPDYPSEIHRTGDNVNEFDISQIPSGAVITNNGDGTLTLANNSNSSGYISTHIKFEDLCPNVKVGDTIVANFNTTSQMANKDRIYISTANIQIYRNIPIVVTQDMLDNYVVFYGGYNEIAIISEIKLEKDTQVTPYSPYGCGNINEKIQNANLVDIEELLNQNAENITKNADGSITFTSKSSSYNTGYSKKIPVPSKYSYKIKNGTGANFRLRFVYEDGTVMDGQGNGTGSEEVSINNQPSVIHGDVVEIRCNWTTRGTFTIREFMFNKGTTALPYIPYAEQNISFPLAEGQYFAQGDYLADDGIHHVRQQKICNGSEDWRQWSASLENVERFYLNIDGSLLNKDTLTNRFSYELSTGDYEHFRYSTTQGKDSQFVLFINKSRLETVNVTGLKKWLQENLLEIEYDLAEEYVEPFTEEQARVWEQIKKIKTYKNVTHISSEDETPATMDMVYVRDLQTVIDSLTNAIISLGGNV